MAVALAAAGTAHAEDTSAPAILQMFEARWDTIEDRMADVFQVGYGQMWLPPPERADSSNYSVGYDLFDRFDLGQPRNETLYGTETSLKTTISAGHQASVSMYTDLIWNHNGFGDSLDEPFVALGGYPGFTLTLPNDAYGDFHNPSDTGDIQGQLAGLVDIAQEKDYLFIRQPVEVGNPDNIPAGTMYNKPDPNNARFYPDQDLGGLVLNDPQLGTVFTRYDFNTSTPLAGDPTMENALGLLMRNAQWMVQSIGVDGFRVDAAKHMPTWVLDHLDQAVFRANPRLNLDGTFKPVFSFSEILDGNQGNVQSFIRKDLPSRQAIDPSNTTVGGNRDALDFPLFFAMRNNLTSNGYANNWHAIRNASQDVQDDGYHNGSQGVTFVDSHDDLPGGFPYLKDVAYAYTLMLPSDAIVYMNAKGFGDNREFPIDGRDDALGGVYGDTITTLVDLRNTHGRGDFRERWIDGAFDPNGFSNIYVYERSNSAIVGLNSRLDAGYDERSPVQTDFAPGTVLVELTGNAADPVVDPGGDIPEAIRVDGTGHVTIRIPRNDTHGRGYVVYGVATPEGTLSLTGVASPLSGAEPSTVTNGTARLADIDVITGDSFSVRLGTTPVTLPAPMGEVNPVRDYDADGDTALVRLDEGMDLNNVPGYDNPSPSNVAYGFEDFTDVRTPGYIDDGVGGNIGTGSGLYEQNIDATTLSEGRHYVTVRAFRHRDSGPAVFTDFKQTIYVDRLPPEAEIISFDPFASAPTNPNNRDMIVRSVDGTANDMHMFLDLPASWTDAQVVAWAQTHGQAGQYDRDSFVLGFTNLPTGNHVATILTLEPTDNYSVQRFPGQFTDTNIGAGFGDTDSDGVFEVNNIRGIGNRSVEDIIYSQNEKFSAAVDVNGDGLGDDRDLFALGDELVSAGASQAVLDSYVDLLLHRGDVDGSDTTDAADVQVIYSHFGSTDWLYDLNVDGVTDSADVETMVTEVFRSAMGDFDLNGAVDGDDFLLWQQGVLTGNLYTQGDANLDGQVDLEDLAIWRSAFGFQRAPLLAAGSAAAAGAAVPEPSTQSLAAILLALFGLNYLTWKQARTGACRLPSDTGATDTRQIAS